MASILAAARIESPAWGETPSTAPAPFQFALPLEDATSAVSSLAPGLEAPAGARGFITAQDGHLFAGGKRHRFLGLNLTGPDNFPLHEEAEQRARHLAKMGIGCVRMQGLDASTSSGGLLQEDLKTLDQDALEKLDYFVAALKKQGIYVILVLHSITPNTGQPADPAQFADRIFLDYFDANAATRQRAFARDLMTHINASTRTAYAKEPAIACLEIRDAGSLVQAWWEYRMDDLPAPQAEELSHRWNDWLAAKYGNLDNLRNVWNAHEQEPGEELLGKGPQSSWQVERSGNAAMKSEPTTAADGTAGTLVRVVQPGADAGQGHFVRYHFPVDATKSYTFRFQARSDRPRSMTVDARQLWFAGNMVTVNVPVAVTPEWKPFSVTFTPRYSLGEARFGFCNLAAQAGEWGFAGLSLKTSGAKGLLEGETLGHVGVLRRRDAGARTPEAQRDWQAFLLETEASYWKGQQQYLKNELHTGNLVLGPQANGVPAPLQTSMDAVKMHATWPPAGPVGSVAKNRPLINEPDGGIIGQLGMLRVVGKPYLCTFHSDNAEGGAESLLLLSAYAALQDWDGILLSTSASLWNAGKSGKAADARRFLQSPQMAALPAAAAIFVRGDVRPASPRRVAWAPEATLDLLRQFGPMISAQQLGARAEETLRHPVEIACGQPATAAAEPVMSVFPGITSDSADLRWDRRAEGGLVTVDTPRSAGVMGTASESTFQLMQTRIALRGDPQSGVAVNLTVREGSDFQHAKRILITATVYANSGTPARKSPGLVDGVSATFTLPALPEMKAWALDERGQHRSEVPLKVQADQAILEISPQWKTLWYEVEAASGLATNLPKMEPRK